MMIFNYFMTEGINIYSTFVTNSKIISWPVCTSLHSCSNPFPKFEKNYLLWNRTLLNNVYSTMYIGTMYIGTYVHVPEHTKIHVFENVHFELKIHFSENAEPKMVSYGHKRIYCTKKDFRGLWFWPENCHFRKFHGQIRYFFVQKWPD